MWNTKHKNLFDLKKWPKTKSTHYAKWLKNAMHNDAYSVIEGTQTRNINFLTNPWVHVQTSTYTESKIA